VIWLLFLVWKQSNLFHFPNIHVPLPILFFLYFFGYWYYAVTTPVIVHAVTNARPFSEYTIGWTFSFPAIVVEKVQLFLPIKIWELINTHTFHTQHEKGKGFNYFLKIIKENIFWNTNLFFLIMILLFQTTFCFNPKNHCTFFFSKEQYFRVRKW
jgi:hypothetical protein